MSRPNRPFTVQDLAEICDVSSDVVEVWHANGVAPECIEERTPSGIKRLYTAEAIREFCFKHRMMLPPVEPTEPTEPAGETSALVGGGAFFGK
jgi:hypothetical protein